ncbi:hypothetical protein DM02DRAFT_621105 [Periconia macrospinosa]|uniref:Uncharacterized protein n=1 Tax=Periconia macrospinosa TaxID=97972 RepID=A0A2V1CX66_9PLEO|nr:hypothetical protein DM02DRAFT_621105 [Periconia macrospinosa]
MKSVTGPALEEIRKRKEEERKEEERKEEERKEEERKERDLSTGMSLLVIALLLPTVLLDLFPKRTQR